MFVVAVMVAGLPWHIAPAVNAILTVGVKVALTAIVNAFETAVFEVRQTPLVDIVHVTTSPFESVELVKELEAPDCTLTPFTWKVYITGPVLVLDAVAVKVTGVPKHMEPIAVDARLTAGVIWGSTFTVICEDQAEFVVRHKPSFTIMLQLIISPFANELEVKVVDVLFCAITPLT